MRYYMKKILLTMAVVATAFSLQAENKAYLYTTQDGQYSQYGSMRRVSPDGKWAISGDYNDYTGSLLIDISKPDQPIYIADGEAMDVSNDGLVAGCAYVIEGTGENIMRYEHAGIWHDGAWEYLPESEDLSGRCRAVAISSDGKYIGGYMNAYQAGTTGKKRPGSSYPCRWVRNDATGEYELELFNDWKRLDERGFTTYDMTEDGRYLVGYYTLGCSSTIPAIYDAELQELKLWNKYEIREEPTYYKDEIIGYYEEFYIDDFHDTDSNNGFNGMFISVENGICYGQRTIATDTCNDPKDENYGLGTLTTTPCTYDMATDTFTDYEGAAFIYGNTDHNLYFNMEGRVIDNGVVSTVEAYFDIHPEQQAGGIYHCSSDGKVFGGSCLEYNEALQGYVEIPLLIVCDEAKFPENSVEGVEVADKIRVNVSEDVISVEGASEVAVYSIDGKLVSRAARTGVSAGIYVVKADSKIVKVLVK